MGFDGKKPERLKCRTSVEVSKKWRLVKNRREIVANVTYYVECLNDLFIKYSSRAFPGAKFKYDKL